MIPSVKKQCILCIHLDQKQWKFKRSVCTNPKEIKLLNGICKKRKTDKRLSGDFIKFLGE